MTDAIETRVHDACDFPDAETIIARAADLVPTLRSRIRDRDSISRIPDVTLKQLNEVKLFELTTPLRYGGLQTSIRTYKETVAQLGRGDASTAWTVSLINVCNWLAATLYPKEVSEEMFCTPGGLRACSVLSSRKASVRSVQNGYIIDEGPGASILASITRIGTFLAFRWSTVLAMSWTKV